MRMLIAAPAALALSTAMALAQAPSPAPGSTTPAPAQRTGKSAVDDAMGECMRLWDAGTHMSKQEWAATCKRIQSRLENLKIDNLDLMGTGMRKKSGGINSSSRSN